MFTDITFDNVAANALTWFFEPPQSWATNIDCGDFPCTGPKNTIFSFKKSVWQNTPASSDLNKEDF